MRFDPLKDEVLNGAVDLVLSACKAVFGSSLVCVILKGSAVKGDFIPSYSDLDFHVFLKSECMAGENAPRAEYAIRFQKAFGHVNPEDFEVSQFQIYFVNSEKYPKDWAPPVEGAYKVLWGVLPSSAREADDSTYLRFAKQRLALSSLEYSRRKNVARFVDKPNSRIAPIIRLLGATLKNYMYSVLVLLTGKPKFVFGLELDKMVTLVEEGTGSKGHLRAFFEKVSDWRRIRQDPEFAREAFKEGIQALDGIARWRRG